MGTPTKFEYVWCDLPLVWIVDYYSYLRVRHTLSGMEFYVFLALPEQIEVGDLRRKPQQMKIGKYSPMTTTLGEAVIVSVSVRP